MRKFMTIHTFPAGALTSERIEEIVQTFQTDGRVSGYRSFHSLSEGRIVWLLEAENRDAIVGWCRDQNLPLDGITELELEGHVGIIRKADDPDAGKPPLA
ncbi:MAG: hypothetical protein WCP07_02015 [bacterium]